MVHKQTEDLRDSEPAGCWRPHTADLVGPIDGADCLPEFCLIRGKIMQVKVIGDGRSLRDSLDDVCSYVSGIECLRPVARDHPQGCGEGGIF